ncbi:hypothetical protein JCM19046_198 [Bacillus sp. JCM 19046]|nr:hypothetical protein JCM19045_3916 [Bacillus sp. JCM 19045]GAF15799.1 hypothetical protein JCM19046_198 [Bacillus sp. JCM 19046]
MKKVVILSVIAAALFGIYSYSDGSSDRIFLAEELTPEINDRTKLQINDYRYNQRTGGVKVAVTEDKAQIDLLLKTVNQLKLQETEAFQRGSGPYDYLFYLKPTSATGETIAIYKQGLEYRGRYYTYVEETDLTAIVKHLDLDWNTFK